VVFIHGLDGGYEKTWGLPDEEAWPYRLVKACPRVAAWSFAYEISSSAWRGWAMPLSDRADNALVRVPKTLT